MLGRSLLLIVLIPLIELVLLSQLLQRTSLTTTILVVLLTGIIGISLTRHQGMKAWRGVHQQMAQGKSPSKEILDGAMILFAGAFLITPGLLTDCVGFSLLLPPVRSALGRRLTRWFKDQTIANFQMQGFGAADFKPDDTDAAGPSVRVVDPDAETARIDD